MIVQHGTISHIPGLPCRLPGGCPEGFVARLNGGDKMDALDRAARQRDQHEHEIHGYVHPPPAVTKWHSPYAGRARR